MSLSAPRITVVSAHSDPRLPAPLNHQVYCRRHGYQYFFDATPYPLTTVWDQKLLAMERALADRDCDWVFWIDDDAFFAQLDVPLTAVRGRDVDAPWGPAADDDRRDLALVERPELIHVCRSPVNPVGKWSAINAGLLLLRNHETVRDLLRSIRSTPMDVVKQWWRPEVNGNLYADDGDQERMQYLICTRGWGPLVALHDPLAFNARPYHIADRVDEVFVCHLANFRDKVAGVAAMRERFGLDEFLLPPGALADLAPYRHSMFVRMTEPPPVVEPGDQATGVEPVPEPSGDDVRARSSLLAQARRRAAGLRDRLRQRPES